MESIDETPTGAADYAALNAVWGALATGLLATTREDAPPLAELPLFGLASFAVTKALAKEKVGVWVREPLVREGEEGRPPKGTGLRFALGELVTCTRCLGTWSSLGLVGLRLVRPREGRVLATVLASAALNDWLQAGFNAMTSRANVEAMRAETPLDKWPEAASAAAASA